MIVFSIFLRCLVNFSSWTFFIVSVKWGKEKYDNIELNTSEPVLDFKARLMSLTGVEPDRQKVMLKGSALKESWDSFKGLKDVSSQ